MGTAADARRRKRYRIDNDRRQKTVETARKLMFEKGLPITSPKVQRLLGQRSMVPTRVSTHLRERGPADMFSQNAFSDVLSSAGQDYHEIFVVDLLHEFEIGVWKSVLTHLIRILYATPGGGIGRVASLDDR